ncbi:protein sym1 [Mucor ambiguus]|uniref:Protein sym1 n=1 Tax=Mucor ambiguus TaxID=91626 RepID=A0A0C9MUC9_9FUNG|nr:protein sym1 [Mucor ambiguus]
MFAAYHRVLTKRPILIQSLSTAVLFGAGDLIAQQFVEKQGWDKHDFTRTFRMTAFGGIFAGPALSNWYRFIDKKVTTKNAFQGLATKVVLDQFIFAPFFIAAFFTGQGIFEGKSLQEIKDKLSSGYTTALVGNYKIWPAVQVVNFYFTPLNYRLMVTNVVALGWNAYLSTVNQRSSH